MHNYAFWNKSNLTSIFFEAAKLFSDFLNTLFHISLNKIFHFPVNLFPVNCIIASEYVTHYEEIPENSGLILQVLKPRTIGKNSTNIKENVTSCPSLAAVIRRPSFWRNSSKKQDLKSLESCYYITTENLSYQKLEWHAFFISLLFFNQIFWECV